MGKASVANGSNERSWRGLVERATHDPSFIGWTLRQYAALHHLIDEQVLSWLECHHDRADRLALCRAPGQEEAAFAEHVRAIAQFVDCNAERLVQLLREINAFEALRAGHRGASETDLLMAARDRKDVEDPGRKKR